jgi:sterol desaturase/sphingolipid hydroxylase (fatty acid hydroxylase superfamily)
MMRFLGIYGAEQMFNIINCIVVGGFLAFIAIDSLAPARVFPKARYWKLRGVAAAFAYLAAASYSPFLWVEWLTGPLLFDATTLPFWLQLVLGYAAIQFVSYWWHRALHSSDILWRVFHQMHHSIERMDGWGALYHSPLDVVGFTFAGSFALTMIVGISPMAAAMVGVFGMAAVFFTHCNIRTPQWIGRVMQRPEGHGLHHERGRHAGNYTELVIWDRLFGTYENPREWNGEAGFYDGASLRIWEMLTFRDVSRPKDAKVQESGRSARTAISSALVILIYAGTLGLLVIGGGSVIAMGLA